MTCFKTFLCMLLCCLPLPLLPTATPKTAPADDGFAITAFSGNAKIPYNSLKCLHQDPLGFIWAGTENGLYRYDGFHAKRFASNLLHPDFLTSNDITCLCDDGASTLWIGTSQGVTAMNLRLGTCRHYHMTDFDNADAISTLFHSRRGDIWAGTQGGLYKYNPQQDRFELYCNKRGNAKIPHCSVTSIIEDAKGCMWVGTWDRGLYRFHEHTGRWYEMPRFNDNNSALHIYADNARGRLFTGTWGKGLYVIDNPYDTGKPLRFTAFTKANTGGALPSDYIWQIDAPANGDRVWIGTSKGLAWEKNGRVAALPSWMEPEPGFFGRGAGGLLPMADGSLWLYGSGRGLAVISRARKRFGTIAVPAPYSSNDYITALAFAPDERLWIGLHDGGILYQDIQWQWRHIATRSQVYCFNFQDDGSVLAGTEQEGILTIRDGQTVGQYNTTNSPWLKDNCVYSLQTTAEGSLLIGTWRGISTLDEHGRGSYVTTPRLKALATMKVKGATRGSDGSWWLATRGSGIVRLRGNLSRPPSLAMKVYDTLEGSAYRFKDIYRILSDAQGNVWACSLEAGLLRYDSSHDAFTSMNKALGIPDEEVFSIEESPGHHLWLSSRNSLLAFTADGNGRVCSLRVFARTEALGGEMFGHGRSAGSMRGRLAFAGSGRCAVFTDEVLRSSPGRQHAFISDIKVYDTYLSDMDSTLLSKVSSLLPPYTRQITLCHDQRDVTLEISSPVEADEGSVRFAYMLEGYDKEWRYADTGVHQVNYNNLPTGHYTFLLKSTDENGSWSGDVQKLSIRVLAPWYLRWYALVVYALLLTAVALLVVHYYRNREKSRREVQLAHMESKNIEELNHKKLQFFTNITHDLMTPLTVISATVGTLRESHPADSEPYRIIDANVSRLMRLLQQILEFRKTETGNLHLRVAKGNLTDFFKKEVESILPLANSRHLHLSLHCHQPSVEGYFDADALDKILYNLISNAAKYNHEGGTIDVTLDCADGRTAVFAVSDTGSGIAADKLPGLFKRFYEGEHRKFKTYGTGIGLSLVKDLTEVHHGTISVESEEGKGSRFTVTIPIYKEAFKDIEIDDSTTLMTQPSEPADTTAGKEAKPFTVLLVEDNEDLADMLRKLLSHHYNVLTAYNGQEALDLLHQRHADLVVTDIMMPVMDGVELTRHIREDSQLDKCPVIMLTAKRDDEDRAEAYRVGADAYITKPFNTSVLLARIGNLLEHRQKTDREIVDKLFGGIKGVRLSGSDEDFVSRCIATVQKHIADVSFDQPLFALEMGTSKSTLYKKLRATTGQSTTTFIRSIRMQAACQLLKENPQARVADIAYAVGYNDPKYFSACFKKDFGCLPSEYMAEQPQKPTQNSDHDG